MEVYTQRMKIKFAINLKVFASPEYSAVPQNKYSSKIPELAVCTLLLQSFEY